MGARLRLRGLRISIPRQRLVRKRVTLHLWLRHAPRQGRERVRSLGGRFQNRDLRRNRGLRRLVLRRDPRLARRSQPLARSRVPHRLDLNLVRHQLDRNPVLRQSRCDRNRDRSRKRDRLRILQLDRSRNRILLRSLVLLRSRGRRRRGRNRVPRLRPNRSLARRANRARNIRNES